MVTINGEKVDAKGMTLSKYLSENNYNVLRIAVECNDVIVPKAKYDEIVLKDGDTIEIVSFVGGG